MLDRCLPWTQTDTYGPDDACELSVLKGSEYDPSGYPALEKSILEEVDYCTISHTLASN